MLLLLHYEFFSAVKITNTIKMVRLIKSFFFFWLSRCSQPSCRALVRPHVVWFGESLNSEVLRRTDAALEECDMCLLVSNANNVFFSFIKGLLIVL